MDGPCHRVRKDTKLEDSQADMVRKVQALWAQADDPATPAEARPAFVAKAKELMAKYAISEIVLSTSANGHDEIIMADIMLYEEQDDESGEGSDLVSDQRMTLGFLIARSNRCKAIVTDKDETLYADGTIQPAGCYLLVYGYRSDVRMVELLYTNLITDMVYRFYKTEFRKMKSQKSKQNAMINFCVGYVRRIRERLEAINTTVHEMAESDGSLLPVLRSREAAVSDHFDELYPPDTRTSIDVRGYKPDAGAQDAGSAAASQADLGGKKIDVNVKGAIN